MKFRSHTTVVIALTAMIALSGCAALANGGPLEATAQNAELDEETVSETGYEFQTREDYTLNRTVTFADQERDVIAHTNTATYSRSLEQAPSVEGSQIALLATPGFSVAGQNLNPIARLSNDELITQVLERSNVGAVSNVETVDEYTVEVDGEMQNVSKYNLDVERNGESVTVVAHLMTVSFEDTTVVAVGVTPVELDEEESPIIRDAFTGVSLADE